jgi:hypothetical protein
MRGLVTRLALALLTGYVFVYFSELLFWALPQPGTGLAAMLPTWLAYSFLAYVFLALVAGFRVDKPPGVFLAGALFGWLTEGVLAQTLYDSFPLNISFTGLAWHGLLTVMVGWWALPRALRAPRPASALLAAALLGLGYGLWAIAWWVDSPPVTATVPALAAYAFTATALLSLAYWATSRLDWRTFAPGRWERAGAGLLIALYFVFVTVPAQPLALVILPPLVLVVVAALWRHRRRSPPLTPAPRAPITLGRAALLLAVPAVATLVYALAAALGARVATSIVVYGVTMPLGFAALAWALVRVWRGKRPAAASAGSV